MAFDKNNTSLGMKIVIVFFAVVLVVSMCLPFFSSCSITTTTTDGTVVTSSNSSQPTTAAGVQAQYQTLLGSLQDKLAADPTNLTAVVSLANNYKDCAMAMQGTTDAASNEALIAETFQSAVGYYDTYLAAIDADDPNVRPVSVDRAVCLYYAGEEEQAIADLEAFLETNADYAIGWCNLGFFYYQRGEYGPAREAFNACVELDPNGETTAGMYGQIYLSVIDSIEAAEAEAAAGTEAPEGTTGEDATTEGTVVEEAAGEETAGEESTAGTVGLVGGVDASGVTPAADPTASEPAGSGEDSATAADGADEK